MSDPSRSTFTPSDMDIDVNDELLGLVSDDKITSTNSGQQLSSSEDDASVSQSDIGARHVSMPFRPRMLFNRPIVRSPPADFDDFDDSDWSNDGDSEESDEPWQVGVPRDPFRLDSIAEESADEAEQARDGDEWQETDDEGVADETVEINEEKFKGLPSRYSLTPRRLSSQKQSTSPHTPEPFMLSSPMQDDIDTLWEMTRSRHGSTPKGLRSSKSKHRMTGPEFRAMLLQATPENFFKGSMASDLGGSMSKQSTTKHHTSNPLSESSAGLQYAPQDAKQKEAKLSSFSSAQLPKSMTGVHLNHMFSCCDATAEVPDMSTFVISNHMIFSPRLDFADTHSHTLRHLSRERLAAFLINASNPDRFRLAEDVSTDDKIQAIGDARYIVRVKRENFGTGRGSKEWCFAVKHRGEYIGVEEDQETKKWDEECASVTYDCDVHKWSFFIGIYKSL